MNYSAPYSNISEPGSNGREAPELLPVHLESLRTFAEAETAKRNQARALLNYRPYPKQALFHRLGATLKERLLRAGNQQGKTFAGGQEMAMHLTGIYPDEWPGRRFDKPVDAWAACDTGETTRDNPQRVLLGKVGSWGSGTIPADMVLEMRRGRGVADLLDTVLVRHKSGGTSRLGFKRYDQGRESWQGPSKDVIWCDEEPPEDVYAEALARLIATNGIIYTTFTPLKGMSKVVDRLINGPGDVNMTIEDAQHIPASERAKIIAAFPEHEREARARGVPLLGGGLVFPIADASVVVPAFPPPAHWFYIGAIDFGWDHPFAAVKLGWDRDTDTVYVMQEYRIREQTPVVHAAALRGWSPLKQDGTTVMPWGWPHDGLQHDKGSGEQLAAQYRKEKLNTLREHATHAAGGFGTEAGVLDMLDRMRTGRLKVFDTCQLWLDEKRHYHRKDGLIVKEKDDLMSATRVGIMSLRYSRQVYAELESEVQASASGRYNPLDGIPSAGDRYGGGRPERAPHPLD